MSIATRFRNHEEFHRTTVMMGALGAAAGLAAFALPLYTIVAVVPMAAVAAAAWRTSLRQLLTRVAIAGLGGAALSILLDAGHIHEALAAYGLCFGIAMGWGSRGKRLFIAVALGLLAGLAAMFVMRSMLISEELASVPAWLLHPLAGAGFSIVGATALIAHHLEFRRDRVGEAYASAKAAARGEVRELVVRAGSIWEQASGSLKEDDANREILEEAVLRLYTTAERWSAADAEGAGKNTESLVERMESLESRIAATKDKVVAREYEQARSALAEQLKYLEGINVNRERVLARMHNYLAAIERLRLAVVKLESQNASREAVDLDLLVSNLEELGEDIETCSAPL